MALCSLSLIVCKAELAECSQHAWGDTSCFSKSSDSILVFKVGSEDLCEA